MEQVKLLKGQILTMIQPVNMILNTHYNKGILQGSPKLNYFLFLCVKFVYLYNDLYALKHEKNNKIAPPPSHL